MLAIAATLLAAGASSARATEYTWSNTSSSGDWGTAANWTGGPVPTATDTALFSANTAPAIGTVNLNGNREIGAVRFTNTSGTYTLTGAAFTLTTGRIIESSTGASIIQANILGQGGNLSTTVSQGTLTLTGQVGTAGTPVNITANILNGGKLSFTNTSVTARNNITGTFAVNTTAELSGYAGDFGTAIITVNAGKVTFIGQDASGDNPAFGNNVNLNGSTTLSVIRPVNLGTVTFASGASLSVTTTGTLGAGQLSFTGMKLGGGTDTINTVAALVSVGAFNDQGLNTIVNQTGAGGLLFDQTTVTNTGGHTTFNIIAPLTTVVGGAFDPLGGATVNINGGLGLVIGAKSAAGNLASPINVNSDATFSVRKTATGTASNAALTLTGPLTVASGKTVTLSTADGYSLTLAGAGSWGAGSNLIIPATTLKLGATNALLGASVTMSSGATLDLRGFNQTIGAISGPGTITSTVAGAVNLTVGAGSEDMIFDGIFLDSGGANVLSLTKTGGGTIDLTNINPFHNSGVTTIADGTLRFPNQLGSSATPANVNLVLQPGAGLQFLNQGTGTAANNFTGNITLPTGVLSTAVGGSLSKSTITLAGGKLSLLGGAVGNPNFGNNINVLSGNSSLEVGGQVNLGILTLANGANLAGSTTGTAVGPTYLAGITLAGGTSSAYFPMDVYAGRLNDQGIAGTSFVNNGPGNLVFDQTNSANVGNNTTITMNSGRLYAVGAGGGFDPLGGATVQSYYGITFSAKNATGTASFASPMQFTGDALLDARVGATGTATGATVSLTGSITVSPFRALMLNTADNYTMMLGGPITADYIFHQGGSVKLSAANVLQAATALYVNGGSLDIQTFNQAAGLVTLDGGNLFGSGGILTASSYDLRSGTVSARLGGNADVNVNGPGPVTLTGANLYTGATYINSGVLNIQNAFALGTTTQGTYVLNDGAALEVQNGITVTGEALFLNGGGPTDTNGMMTGSLRSRSGNNTWTGHTTLLNYATIGVDAGTLSMTGGIDSGGGSNTLYKVGAGTLKLSGALTYGGPTVIQGGALSITSPLSGNIILDGGVFQSSDASGGPFTRTLGGGDGQVQWFSSGGFAAQGGLLTVNINSAATLTWGTTFAFVPAGASLMFGSTTADSQVNMVNPINLGNMNDTITVIDNPSSAGDFASLAGVISNGALTKDGTGLLVLANAGNTYAGSTTVLNGTLRMGVAGAVPQNTDVAVVAPGVFDINGVAFSSGALTGTGTVVQSATGTAKLTVGGANTPTGSAFNFGGTLADGGTGKVMNFMKSGPGVVELSGPNAIRYTGTTQVSSGTLLVSGQVGSAISTAVMSATVSGGASLRFTNTGTGAGLNRIGGTLAANGGEIAGVSGNLGAAAISLTSGKLTLTGGGAFTNNVTAAGTSTIDVTGATSLNALTLNAGATVTVTSPSPATSLLAVGGTTLSGGAAASINNSVDYYVGHLNDQGLVSTVNKSGAGSLVFDYTAAVNAGVHSTFNVKQGRLISVGAFDAVLGFNDPMGASSIVFSPGTGPTFASKSPTATIGGTYAFLDNATVDARVAATGTAAGAAVTVLGSFTFPVGKTLTLSTADNYTLVLAGPVTGANSQISGGVIKIAANNIFPSAQGLTVAAGTLDMQTFSNSVGSFHLTGGSVIGSGTLASATAYDLQQGAISANLGGNAGAAKTTTGTVVLSGSNTFGGQTLVQQGVLSVRSANALGATGAGNETIVSSGATLDIAGNITLNPELITISGPGVGGGGALRSTSGANTLSAGTTITMLTDSYIGVDTGTLTVLGSLTGNASLTKVGGGTLFLNGVNSYTGATFVLGGSLVGGLSPNSNLQLNNAVYEGSGTFTRSLGTGTNPGQVQWVAGGGFSAVGGGFTITINNNPASTLAWGTTPFFVPNGSNLMFNSLISTDQVTMVNPIDLGAGNRTISVADNPNLFTDQALLSGVISGSGGGITKIGQGTLVLGNSGDTFTGGTTIMAGTIKIAADAALGAVPGAPTTNLTLNGGTLKLTAPAGIAANRTILVGRGGGTFDTGGFNSAFGGSITGSGPFIKAGLGELSLTLTPPAGPVVVTGGVLTQASLPATSSLLLGGGVFQATGGGSITAALGGGAGQVNWTAGGFAAKNLPLTLNLNGGAALTWGVTPGFLQNGSAMVLGSTTDDSVVIVANPIVFGDNVARLVRVIDNVGTAGEYANLTGQLNGSPTGTGTLVKEGGGVLQLTPTVANAINIIVNAGTVRLGNANGFNSGSLVVNPTGTFNLNGFAAAATAGVVLNSGTIAGAGASAFSLNGAADVTATGTSVISASTLALGAPRAFNVTGANDLLTVSGAITGAQTLTKNGAGTLALSGANNYSGGTIFNAGVIKFGNALALGSGPLTVNGPLATIMADGGAQTTGIALTVNANQFTFGGPNSMTFTSSPTIVTQGGAPMVALNVTSTGTATIAGALTITGGAGLNKIGTGTLVLNGVNSATWTGETVASEGTLRVGASGLPTNGVVTVGPAGTLDLFGSSVAMGQLNGFGTVTSNAGAATVSIGNGNTTGGIFLGSILKGAGATLSLTKIGTGTQFLGGANTFNGVTTVNGVLTIVTGGALGTGTGTGDQTVVNSGSSLHLTGNINVASETLNVQGVGAGSAGALRNLNGANTWGGPVTLAGPTTIGVDSGLLNIAGAVTGAQAATKIGGGTLQLSNAASSGLTAITVNAGGLKSGGNEVIPDAAVLTLNAGAFFDLNGQLESISQLAGAGTFITGGGYINITNSGGSSVFSGSITGPGGVSKSGSNVETFSGANTYTGPTSISAGTLLMGVSGALSDRTAVSLSGGLLDLGATTQVVMSLAGAGGTVNLNTGRLDVGANDGAGTYGGNVTGGGTFNKIGAGTEIITGGGSMTGALAVRGGTLTLQDNGTFSSVGSAAVFSGATLKLDNSASANLTNRLNDAAGLTFNGGTLVFQGAATGASTETIGQITLAPGAAVINSVHGAAGTAALTAAGITRQAGSTLSFTGAELGTASNKVLLNTDPSANGIIAYATMAGASGETFAARDATLGVIPYAGYTASANLNAGATVNVKLSGNAATAAVSTLNSLNLGGFNATLNQSLTLASGGLIAPTGTTSTISGAGALTTTSADLIAHVFGNLTISAPITGAGALTKDGAGNLTIASTGNTYAGGTFINGGKVLLGADNVIPDSATEGVSIIGGTLDLNGHNETVGPVTLSNATIMNSGASKTLTLNSAIAAGTGVTATGVNTIGAGASLGLPGNTASAINVGRQGDILTINGSILNSTGNAGYTKGGQGALVLNGDSSTTPNAYSVTLAAGTLSFGNNNALGGASGGLILNGGTIQAATGGARVINNPVTIGGAFAIGGAESLTLGGTMTGASGTNVITINNTNLTIFTGRMTGAGSFTKTGPGTLLITSTANDYAGNYTGIMGGAVITGDNEVIPNSSLVEIGYSATLNLAGSNESFNALRGVGNLDLGGNASSVLTIGTAGGSGETFYGVISGSGGVQKAGAGTQTLFGANTYGGPTTVNGGTLLLGTSNVLPATSTVVLLTGTLDMNSQMQTIGGLTMGGGAIANIGLLTLAGDVTVSGAAASAAINGGRIALSGNRAFSVTTTLGVGSRITGTGSLTKTGSGVMTISSPLNDFNGGVFVNAGTLRQGASNVLPDYAITVSSATLDRAGFSDTIGPLTLASGTISGAGTYTLAGDVTASGVSSISGGTVLLNAASRNFNVTSGALTVGDVLAGAGYGLTKSGAGTMILASTANSYTGPTTIANGAMKQGAANALAPNSSVAMLAGSLLDLGGFSGITGALSSTDASAVVTSSGAGTITLTLGQNNESGTFTGSITRGAATTLNLAKLGSGVQTLAGANTYNGLTNVGAVGLPGGTLSITNGAALGTTDGGTIVNFGSALQLSGGITVTGEALTLDGRGASTGSVASYLGALRSTSGDNTWAGPITLIYDNANQPATHIGVEQDSLLITGVIGGAVADATGTAGQGLVKVGAGTLILAAQNTYGGITAVNGGTLKLAAANVLPQTTDLVVNSVVDANGFDQSVNGLSGPGLVSLGAGTLTIGTANSSSTFSGMLVGTTGGLIKSGTGTQIMTGMTSLDGSTVVNAGRLVFDGALGSFSGTGTITVKSAAALDVRDFAGYQAAVQAGTFGSNIAVERGGSFYETLTPTTSAGTDINQALTFLGTGSGTSLLSITAQGTSFLPVVRLNNVSLTNGANVYVQATSQTTLNRDQLRLTNVNVTGTATISGPSTQTATASGLSFVNITGTGATLNIGTGAAYDVNVYGNMGGNTPGQPLVLNLVGALLHIQDGAQLGATTIINDTGATAASIDVLAGQTGTGNLTGGVINLANSQRMKVTVQNGTGTNAPFQAVTNTVATRINVGVSPSGSSAWLQTAGVTSATGTVPGTVYFQNVHILENAKLTLDPQNNTFASVDLFLNGPAGELYEFTATGTRASIRSLVSDASPTDTGIRGLKVTGAGDWSARSALTSGVNLVAYGSGASQLDDGFILNGRIFARYGGYTVLNTDPGIGALVTLTTQTDAGGNGGRNGITFINYGNKAADSIGENGWGQNMSIFLGGQTAVRGTVEVPGAGLTNTNVIQSWVEVRNTEANDYDASIQAGWPLNSTNTAGAGTAAVEYTNVHLVEGANVRLQNFNNVRLTADIFLDGNAFVSTVSNTAGGGDQTFVRNIMNNSLTPHTLTVSNTAGGLISFNGTLANNTGLFVDSTTGTVRLRQGFALNNRTLTILGSGDTPVQLWSDSDPGAGTIKLVGATTSGTWNQGLEIRNGMTGTGGLAGATHIEISNGQMLRGYVINAPAQTMMNIATPVLIQADANPNSVDAVLSSREADAADNTGTVQGVVKYSNVTFAYSLGGTGGTAPNATVELRSLDGSKVQLGGTGAEAVHLQGNLALYNNSTNEANVLLGDITAGGNNYSLTLQGASRWHLNSSLSVGQLIIAGGVVSVDPGAALSMTNGATVQNSGELRFNTPVTSGTYTIKGGARVVLANPTFSGTLVPEQDSDIVLASQIAYTASNNLARILIGMPAYDASRLSVNAAGVMLGGTVTDSAANPSIVNTLGGTANNITFKGGDVPLIVGAVGDARPVIAGSRSVTVDDNIIFAGPNTYTGGTLILNTESTATTRRVVVNNSAAFSNSLVELASPTAVDGKTVLEVHATTTAGLTATSIKINPNTELELYGPSLASNLVFAGGSIITHNLSTTASGTIVDLNDMTFDPVSLLESTPGSLTFTKGIKLTGNRRWTIPEGTVTFQGAITGSTGGPYVLTKLGAGSLILTGANTLAGLQVSEGSLIGAAASVPTAPNSVTIAIGAAFGVTQVNHAYSEVDPVASKGILALAADNNKPLAFFSSLSLGAQGPVTNNFTYSGVLTATPENVPVYRLGGGGGTLTVTSALGNGLDINGILAPTNIDIGALNANDPVTSKGLVVLAGANTITGDINVYMPFSYTNVGAIASAHAVNLKSGGTIDLGTMSLPANLVSDGGGISRSGGILTAADMAIFGFGDYIIGSPTGTTSVADGALTNPDASLYKISTNTVTLLAPPTGTSANMYATNAGVRRTEVQGGVLNVLDLSSLGGTLDLRATGAGVLKLNLAATSTTTFGGAVTLDNVATLVIPAGKIVTATGGLILASPTASVTLSGGGTLSTGPRPVQSLIPVDAAGNHAVITITGNTTLTTILGNTSQAFPSEVMSPSPFIVKNGSVLNFAQLVTIHDNINNQKIGTMMAGSTIMFGTYVPGSIGIQSTVSGHGGLLFGVDPEVYAASGTSAFSSMSNPYRLDVAAGTRVNLMDTAPDGVLLTPTFTDANNAVHTAPAYIQKTGPGDLNLSRGYNPASGDARLPYWIVSGGQLIATGKDPLDTGFGATALGYVSFGRLPGTLTQHMEGLAIKNGGTAAWGGQQGFLPADVSTYGVMTDGANGFNPGEFTIEGGGTLTSAAAGLPLALGLTYGATPTTYLCYPTIVGAAGSVPTINVGGQIDFRSGIALAAGGPAGVNINVLANSAGIQFTNNLAGGIGFSGVQTVSVASGALATFKTNMPSLATISNTTGTVVFDPGAGNTINFAGTSVQSRDAVVKTHSGVTDFGGSFITATTPALPGTNQLIVDPTSTLRLGGFTGEYEVMVNGTLAMSASSSADHVVVNNGTLQGRESLTLTATNSIRVGPSATGSTGPGTFSVDAGKTMTLASPVVDNGGHGTLVKTGAGVLVLGAAGSTYSGGTNILDGTVKQGIAGATPVVGAVAINGPTAVLDLIGFDAVIGGLSGTGGKVINSGSVLQTLTLSNVANAIYNGSIAPVGSGPMRLTMAGGTQILDGPSDGTFNTTVASGTLDLRNSQALGIGGTIAITTGTLQLDAQPTNITIGSDKSITLAGSGSGTNNGALLSATGDNVCAANIVLSGGATNFIGVGSGASLNVTGVISSATAADRLTKVGPGVLTISTKATYQNSVTISGGTLRMGLTNALPVATAVNVAPTNAVLDLNGYDLLVSSVTGSGIITSSATGSSMLTFGSVAGTFSGTISSGNAVSLGITKTGGSTYFLTGASNFNGPVNVRGNGTLHISNSLALAGNPSSPVTVFTGAALELDLASGLDIPAKPLSLTGAGVSVGALVNRLGVNTWRGNINVATSASIGVLANQLTLAGTLNNQGAITKLGTGPLIIAGPQNNSPGSSLTIPAGSVTMNTDAGGAAGNSNLTINASGATVLNLASTQHLAALNLTGNAVANFTVGNAGVLVAKDSTIAATSKLDLKTGSMVIDYTGTSPEAAIRTYLQTGFNGGTWTGNQITSSTVAAAVAAGDQSMSLGYADNAKLVIPLTIFGGLNPVAVDTTSVLIKYTLAGDVNMDGKVNDDDVSVVALSYKRGTGHSWAEGDVFGYDGVVTDDDVSLLALNYGKSMNYAGILANGASSSPALESLLMEVSSTPEPATLVLLGLGGLAALLRRRASRRS